MPTINVLEQKREKNIIFFKLKINIFTSVKYCYILYRRVFVMTLISALTIVFQDDDLSMIAAQQYYIEYGSDINTERLQSLLPSYIPHLALTTGLNYWMQQVMSKLRLDYFANNKIEAIKVKGDIVSFAKNKWPILFSRFYEAFKLAGPSLPKNDVLIVVNWTGFYVHGDQEYVLLEVSFPEIAAVSSSRYGDISFLWFITQKSFEVQILALSSTKTWWKNSNYM